MNDEQFGRRAAQALRESEALDPVTQARLSAARRRALQPGATSSRAWLGGLGAVATLLLLSVWAWHLGVGIDPAEPDGDMLELLAGEAAGVDPALVEELDFLTWLSESGEAA